MIDLDFIQSLIKPIDASDLDYIEIERRGTRIKLAKTPEQTLTVPTTSSVAPDATVAAESVASDVSDAVDSQPDTSQSTSDLFEIKSPMVGTFYMSPAPDAPPYTEVGGNISPGDTLCIIEAMKLMNELESEVSGVIQEVCIENMEPVEFGQVLFRVSLS